jgi:hypothetical protein
MPPAVAREQPQRASGHGVRLARAGKLLPGAGRYVRVFASVVRVPTCMPGLSWSDSTAVNT